MSLTKLSPSLIRAFTGNPVGSVLQYTRVYVSKIVGDASDKTAELQAELNEVAALNNSLGGGVFYSMRGRGVVLTGLVVMPTCTNMAFDFTGTTFKTPDGYDPLDKDIFRFNSIRDSVVHGMSFDGNIGNVVDTGTQGQNVGRMIMLRLGNGSKNTKFYNTKFRNAPYCASQWGNNIDNITFDGIDTDNIGEHVFYISGTGGGAATNLTFKNIVAGSHGVNPNARWDYNGGSPVLGHETVMFKSSQTAGANKNWVIENLTIKQTTDNGYAYAILTADYLHSWKLKNIYIYGNVLDAVFYPRHECYYGEVDGVFAMDSTVNCRLVYSSPSVIETKNIIGNNIQLPNSSTQEHIQVFDRISDSTLWTIRTSARSTGTYSGGKKVCFERVKFYRAFSLQHVNFPFIFDDCEYLDSTLVSGTGMIDPIGAVEFASDAYVVVDGGKMYNTAGYSVATQNNNARVELRGIKGVMPVFSRAGTTMASLVMENLTAALTPNPVNPAVSASLSSFNNVKSTDGTRNFTKYKGDVSIAIGATSNTRDLSAVLLRAPTPEEVRIVPTNATAAGIGYYVTVSGFSVTVTLASAPAGSAATYKMLVDISG
ncbi:hypothetical protein [Klebsiella phage vB_KvaP_F4M1D]|nr:hypothetical protein [Klebsiella phage vB_KvaP_F4M1D]